MGPRIATVATRRRFLWHGFVLTVVGWIGRSLLAQSSRVLRYRQLARPTLVPLADVSTPWRSRQFVAEAVTLPSAASPNQPIRVTGMVVRTAAGGTDRADQFSAVCVRCPHELCDVDYRRRPQPPAAGDRGRNRASGEGVRLRVSLPQQHVQRDGWREAGRPGPARPLSFSRDRRQRCGGRDRRSRRRRVDLYLTSIAVMFRFGTCPTLICPISFLAATSITDTKFECALAT